MSKYEVLIFLHILGSFLLLAGAGAGTATLMAMTRTNSVRAISLLVAATKRADMFGTVPGSLMTIVFGTWLIISFDAFDFSEAWISGAYLLWISALLLGTVGLAPYMKPLEARAAELEAAGVESSDELQALAKAPRGMIVLNALHVVVLAMLALMVFKPGA